MEILDDIIDALKDGQWHSINEISTHERLRNYSMTKLIMGSTLLDEYGFIELSEKVSTKVEYGGKRNAESFPEEFLILEAKLSDPTLEFIRKIRWIEKSERS